MCPTGISKGYIAKDIKDYTCNGCGENFSKVEFDAKQLDEQGAISLDEFAACFCVALAPARAATERTQAPLARALLESTPIAALSEIRPQESVRITVTQAAATTARVNPPLDAVASHKD